MESSSSLSFFLTQMPRPRLITTILLTSTVTCSWKQQKRPSSLQVSAISYHKFIHFALDQTKRNTHLVPSPLQERFSSMISTDGNVELQMLSFEAPKIRLLRSLSIESETMQVKDAPRAAPIYKELKLGSQEASGRQDCQVIERLRFTRMLLAGGGWEDLNPLHDVINQRDYKEKYYTSLLPLGVKYAELLPWGGKLTSESLNFFSPIVIWTKFTPSQHKYNALYSAFVDYYKAWLALMDDAATETDASRVVRNREAQHRYLAWRAEKDPGHGVLKKLIGDTAAKDLLRNFLFHGINELGSKSFLDYFPDYRSDDGTVIERRSMIGKSFENRPWDARGEFIGSNSTN
ncbi:Ferredoxin-dependent bilin reductase [Parasponia andersonii]|uniref:Ferredoxin-dependent bilin reductase n=1 Tax=Parasponia andersonii TaxID=3476 RepID=A0A2P5DR95_PARAD|nr:Ferredoxin-dependent bilin reductase [Parasponia andersonii]